MKRVVQILFYVILVFSLFSFQAKDHVQYFTLTVPNGFGEPIWNHENPISRQGVELGKRLFFDPILSKNNKISCASCHLPKKSFSDNNKLSKGIFNQLGDRNASVLVNLAWSKNLFWDGRAKSLEEQALAPVVHVKEMGESWSEVVNKIKEDSLYLLQFNNVFKGKSIDSSLIVKAIAQFERTLISSNSKFDQFRMGKISLTEKEKRGYNLFMSAKAKCSNCHKTPLFTDNALHSNGLSVGNDLGAFSLQNDSLYYGKFITPTLRNIGLSAPYMHDGRFKNLKEVLAFYGEGNTSSHSDEMLIKEPIQLNKKEQSDLISFLHTLTDTAFVNNY